MEVAETLTHCSSYTYEVMTQGTILTGWILLTLGLLFGAILLYFGYLANLEHEKELMNKGFEKVLGKVYVKRE